MSLVHASTLEYLERRFDEIEPRYRFRAKSEEEFLQWQRELRGCLRERLGLPLGNCELQAEVVEEVEEEEYTRQKVTFQSEEDATVFAWVLVPRMGEPPYPAVLCLHGHGYGKDDVIGRAEPDEFFGAARKRKCIQDNNYDYGRQFARRGYLAIAPDARMFGERQEAQAGGMEESGGCYPGTLRGVAIGVDLTGLRAWDDIRAIDYLETRQDVDEDRIGCAGLSLGGIRTMYLAALDERVRVACISGWLNTFREFLMNATKEGKIYQCTCAYTPVGLYRYADYPDIAGLIAPRPLILESGTSDPVFPLSGAMKAFHSVKAIYDLVGCRDRVDIDVFDGGHRFSGRKSFDWMDRWLREEKGR